MRKLVLIVVFCILAGIFLGLEATGKYNLSSPSPTPQVESEKTAFKVSKPKNLLIPGLSVESIVESVALDKQGKMDVPKNVDNVGWYSLAAKPGEAGNAVIAGHLDKINGQPAVFFNIAKIKIGEELTIIDEDKQQFKFKVTEVKTYDFDKVPLEEIFGANQKSRLNLITCGGYFDNAAKNYSQRVVVYSELVN